MTRVALKGALWGLYGAAVVLAVPLSWRLGIWLAGGTYMPPGEIWLDPR